MPERVVLGKEHTVVLRTGKQAVVWWENKFFNKEDLEWVRQDDDLVASGWSSIHILSHRLS